MQEKKFAMKEYLREKKNLPKRMESIRFFVQRKNQAIYGGIVGIPTSGRLKALVKK